jgi:hypothetical protein
MCQSDLEVMSKSVTCTAANVPCSTESERVIGRPVLARSHIAIIMSA